MAPPPPPLPKLLLDSGASFHMVGNSRLLSNLRKAPPGKTVTVANGNVLPVTKIGDIEMVDAGGFRFTIPGVHLAPGLTMDLISVRELTRQSRICTFFDGDRATLYAGPDLVGVAVASPLDNFGLYVLQYLSVPKVRATAASAKCLDGEMKLVWRSSSARTSRPIEVQAPAATMSFPPWFKRANSRPTLVQGILDGYNLRQSLEPAPKEKRKCVNSSSGPSKRRSIEISSQKWGKYGDSNSGPSKSSSIKISSKKRGSKYGDSNSGPSKRPRSGSNQPKQFPIEVNAKTIVKAKKEVKAKANNKEAATGGAKNDIVPFDCPAMATRSKVAAMATRSKVAALASHVKSKKAYLSVI